MSEESNTKPSTAFWVIGGLLAVWNLSLLYQYYTFSTLERETLEAAGAFTAEQLDHIFGTPAWAHSAYAIAVNAGVLGVIFLLLRKTWAMPMFVISLVGAVLQFADAYLLRNGLELFERALLIIPTLVILVCIFEIWYSLRARSQGWLT